MPPYPLYKSLASALLRCMDSEEFCWTDCNLAMTHENTSMQQKHNEWHKLILEKGSQIVNVNCYMFIAPFVCYSLSID